MTHVLIHAPEPAAHIAKLTAAFPQVTFTGCRTHGAFIAELENSRADVAYTINFAADRAFPREALMARPDTRWVSVGGSGTDHLGNWDPDTITVTNSAGVASDMMAEYVIGTMLHFSLDVPGWQRDQQAHRWNAWRMVRSVKGKTLLIVGLGNTGRAVARQAKALGLHVIATRANPRPTPPCDEVHGADQLALLWARADFIAICTPRLPATIDLVNANAFALMKPTAVLINVARGRVVNEEALMQALGDGRLGGAAMDVFANEPLPGDSPLWDTPNLLISPHCSAVYDGWEAASIDLFMDNLGRYLNGERLENIVNPARGY